jgi:hypothetical protein
MPYTEQSLVYLSRDYRFVASFGAVGASSSAGGAVITDNDDTSIINPEIGHGVIFQEVLTASGSNTFTVTENNGVLPENAAEITIYRNGLLLNQTYISSLDAQNGEFTLSFTPDVGDRIAVVWFYRGEIEDNGIYQEIFTPNGSSDTFTCTDNNGIIPSRKQEMLIYQNGIFIDSDKVTNYSQTTSEFTLNYTPSADDSIAAIWFMSLPNNLKIIQEQFIADGAQTTFTVTKNGGKLAKTKDAILLMRNGQHINNDYISGINTTNGTITMTFAPDQGDDITLIWFVEEFVTPTGTAAVSMFQEEFTADGVSATFTVTENEGKLPEDLPSIMIYRNGQFISNQFISSHDPVAGTVTFGFVPRSGEKITIVWVVSNL